MTNANTATADFRVPYLLSFGKAPAKGPAPLVMGRGEAGWTTADFGTAVAALAFAEALPEASRTRAHTRLVERLRKGVG